MDSSNNKTQGLEPSQSTTQDDSAKDRQLELEIRAFAELVLDIYEYRYRQKQKKAISQPDI
jgi:hypothetical protein